VDESLDRELRYRLDQAERKLDRMDDLKADAVDVVEIRKDLKTITDVVNAMRRESAEQFATIKTKIGFWSALGSLAGAGIVTAIIAFGSQGG
jgi:hypothetical protein